MIGTAGRLRAVLVVVTALQVGWHAVLSVLPGGVASACWPVTGHVAGAAVRLAWFSLPAGCPDAAATDARHLALTAVLTALPVLAVHTLMTAAGLGGWAWARHVERVLRDVLRLVVVRRPEPVLLPVWRATQPVLDDGPAARIVEQLGRVLSRRGPPATLLPV